MTFSTSSKEYKKAAKKLSRLIDKELNLLLYGNHYELKQTNMKTLDIFKGKVKESKDITFEEFYSAWGKWKDCDSIKPKKNTVKISLTDCDYNYYICQFTDGTHTLYRNKKLKFGLVNLQSWR
jgi:hypothetical protein